MSHFGPLVRLGFAGDKGSLEAFEGALWLDCRFDLKDSTLGEERYLKGHIPGAIYAHLERDLSGRKTPQSGRHPLPSIDEMRARFEALGVSSDRPVIAYDDSDSAFAARAWWMLTFLGHSSVAVLDGGWEAYKKWGLPAETGRISPRPGALSVDIRSDLLITVDQVSSVPCLVDSRDPARFRGEQEPIDPEAMNIPHALN